MPELPEVETIRSDLEPRVMGKKIAGIEVRLPRMIRKHKSEKEIKEKVEGRTVKRLQRRGKSLLFYLDSQDILVLHLGMTGQLLFCTPQFPFETDQYTHVIFYLANGEKILFKDFRQFGQVYVTNKEQLEEGLDLGPEPLSPTFTEEDFRQILNRATKIKPLLMDQKRIAGIGNIYSDEMLFEAGIRPFRPAKSLSSQDIHGLFVAMQDMLKEGIKFRGTSVDNYVDVLGRKGNMQDRHRVYRKTGEPCPKCGTAIERIKLGGRSAHFCPKCQK